MSAAPQAAHLVARQGGNGTTGNSSGLASLPQNDPNPEARAVEVAERDAGFVYGPSLIGEAAFFPNGTMGNVRTKPDMDIWGVDREDIDARIRTDVNATEAAVIAVSIYRFRDAMSSLTRCVRKAA